MSSRKSDILDPPAVGGQAAGFASMIADHCSRGSGWTGTLLSNLPIPLALLSLWLIGLVIEDPRMVDPYIARIIMLAGINIILATSLQLINGISGQFSLGHAGFMAVGAYLAGYPTSIYYTLKGVTQADGSTQLVPLYFTRPGEVLFFYIALLIVLALAGVLLYALFRVLRWTRSVHPVLPVVLVLVLLTWLVIDMKLAYDPQRQVWRLAGSHGIPLVWSRLIFLFSDLFHALLKWTAGPAAFISGLLPLTARKPATLLIALLGGGIMAALAGLVVGLPTLRLRGDYLAIATLGFAEIIRVAITNAKSLGGATGLFPPSYTAPLDPSAVSGQSWHLFPWVYGAALLTALAVWRLARSGKGRAILAVREDEVAAAAIGIDATHHKVLAFIIGAFFAGVAGGLYAHYDGYLNPNSFGFLRSVELVVMVTLGGLGSLPGAILAAVALTVLPELLRGVAGWRMVIYSLLLILIMLARSTGWFARLRERRQT